jgi:predicted RNA binding protein YcfA (HicA-like mRNA interferase family)
MKRAEFLKHLRKYNCNLLREGGRHSLFVNSTNGKQAAVPRHPELSDLLCTIICKQLEIRAIKK